MQTSQNYIDNPNAANYTIAGTPAYQNQQSAIGGSYGGLASQAFGQTNALANTAAGQNSAYQNNVNSTTQSFLNNASGLGNYDSGQASQGSDQQNAAYNAITNMAQGNGPSLAAKNLQAGLNTQNEAVQAGSMSNQGLGGAGNAQRNAASAQTANANNELQAAQQASTAEQLGALSQQNTAANNIRSSNQAQASAASSAGLAQRSLDSGALSNQYSAQAAGNSLANNTALSALGLGYGTQATGLAGQASTSNNAYNANVAQQQASQAYDTALQSEGNTRAQINSNAVQSQAGQNAGIVSTIGNIASGAGQAVALSDQSMKVVTDTPSGTASALQSILGAAPSVDDKGLDSDIANRPAPIPLAQVAATQPAAKSSGSSSGGGGIGGAIGSVVGLIGGLFSDERVKTDIAPGDAQSKEFMDKIKPATFRYKDDTIPGTTKGVNLGVMAQDMQKSYIGRELVEKGDDGLLRYSMPKAVNLSLASLAFLNKRINKLERAHK